MTPPDAGPVLYHVIDARHASANAWRRDYQDDPMRDSLWAWYCEGATMHVRDRVLRRSIQYGLNLAESTMRWATATP